MTTPTHIPAARHRLPTGLATAATTVVTVALVAAGAVELTHGDGGIGGVAAAVLRFIRYAGSLLAVGGLCFFAAIQTPTLPIHPRGRAIAVTAALAAAAAVVASVPFQAAYLTGELGAAVDLRSVGYVLDSGFGASALVGLAGLLVLAFALARLPSVLATGLGTVAVLLVVGSFLLTGHTTTSEPRIVAMGANLAHTTAGAVWLGGLVLLPLALFERRRAGDPVGAGRLLARFSAAATGAIGAVAIAGFALAWVEVRAVAALLTAYGGVLLAKVGVVAAVMALGAYNHRRLVPQLRRGGSPEASWTRLTRIVRLESAGLIAVLAVSAVLVNITPARVEARIGDPVSVQASLGDDHTAELIVEPAMPGRNEVHLYVWDDSGALTDVGEVEYRFTPPGDTDPSATVTPAPAGPGHYLHAGSELSVPGEWTVGVHAEIDGEQERGTLRVPVEGSEWTEPDDSALNP